MCKVDGKKVVMLRNAKQMSQRELAQKAGISQWSVCQVETGKSNGTDETLGKLAKALGVEPNEIDLDARRLSNAIIENRINVLHIRDTSARYLTPEQVQDMLMKLRSSDTGIVEKEAKRAMTKANQSTVGNKTYAVVETKALNVPNWQRDTDKDKCLVISETYDENKYDPIKVYMFEGKLYVADGAHRLVAYLMMHIDYILVEIMNIKTEKDAAETFLLQSLGRRRMSQNDMWRAAIEANLPQYCELRRIAIKHNVQIRADLYTLKNPVGTIVSVSNTLLRMAHGNAELLEREFEIIAALGWNSSDTNPYRTYIFTALKAMYANYKGRENELDGLLLSNCAGTGYYDKKVATTTNKGRLCDILMEDIAKASAQKTA